VVVIEDIYRQYSGGRVSPAALRDMLRHAWQNWGGNLRHVLFFGDGHYDYRNIRAGKGAQALLNLIPPHEFVLENLEQVASDDFYGFLEEGEFGTQGNLDVTLGRVPVQTPAQARTYVEKIRIYESPATAGPWRSRVLLTADDHLQHGSTNNDLDPIYQGHTNDTETLGKIIQQQDQGMALEKVYLLDYPINAAWLKPEASQDLIAHMNRGVLMVNYVGHGASDQWADEVLMKTGDALTRLYNADKLTVLNGFSCTVGRFDKLSGEGMTEQFVKQQGKGAIAGISATRESTQDPIFL
jgi:hypothetical protein